MLIPELTEELRHRLETGADCEVLLESLTTRVAQLEHELASGDQARVESSRSEIRELHDRIRELTHCGERKLNEINRKLMVHQRQRNLERRYGLERY